MKYNELVGCLQKLERKWREKSSAMPDTHECRGLIRNGPHNIQYFACSNHTAKRAESLPVVVDVGINYTQGKEQIPDENPSCSSATVGGPHVEDQIVGASNFEKSCIASFNDSPNAWRSRGCASDKIADSLQVKEFHLVMANFSPWITEKCWCVLDKEKKNRLLCIPPHRVEQGLQSDCFAHLDDLYKALGNEVALWIGHGLAAVRSLFPSFAERHDIRNWLMTANMAAGIGQWCTVDGWSSCAGRPRLAARRYLGKSNDDEQPCN